MLKSGPVGADDDVGVELQGGHRSAADAFGPLGSQTPLQIEIVQQLVP
jgi:hypothetical protein